MNVIEEVGRLIGKDVDVSTLGPVMLRRFAKPLDGILDYRRTRKELNNRLEDDGTVFEYALGSRTYPSPPIPENDAGIKALLEPVFADVNYKVTPLNYQRVTESIAEAKKAFWENGIVTNDNRQTKKELLEEKEATRKSIEESNRAEKARQAKLSKWKFPDLVIVREEYYTMGGDYGDTNGVDSWILENGNYPRRDMNDFRRQLRKCPELNKLSWEAHRSRGARVYAFELKASSGKKVYCSKDRKTCRDEYVGRNGCPGHDSTYRIHYGSVEYSGELEVWHELNKEDLLEQSANAFENASNNIIVRKNDARNGLEVKFEGSPTEEHLAVIKKNGFRWARFAKLWYTKYSKEKEAEIKRLLGVGNGHGESAVESNTPAPESANAVEPASDETKDVPAVQERGTDDVAADSIPAPAVSIPAFESLPRAQMSLDF